MNMSELLSKKFGIIIGAGYLLRDLALSELRIDWYYPVIIGVVTTAYLLCQTYLDNKEKIK